MGSSSRQSPPNRLAPKFPSQSQTEKLTCSPARAERETALAFAFPESLPAFPPAYTGAIKTKISSKRPTITAHPSRAVESSAITAAAELGDNSVKI